MCQGRHLFTIAQRVKWNPSSSEVRDKAPLWVKGGGGGAGAPQGLQETYKLPQDL